MSTHKFKVRQVLDGKYWAIMPMHYDAAQLTRENLTRDISLLAASNLLELGFEVCDNAHGYYAIEEIENPGDAFWLGYLSALDRSVKHTSPYFADHQIVYPNGMREFVDCLDREDVVLYAKATARHMAIYPLSEIQVITAY